MATMDCLDCVGVNREIDFSDDYHYYTSIDVKVIDFSKLIEAVPESIWQDTKIETRVFAQEEITIEPCEKKTLRTGLEIKCFMPISHSIRFVGLKNYLGIETVSKYIYPLSNELIITAVNYSMEARHIKKGMPIGTLIVQANV